MNLPWLQPAICALQRDAEYLYDAARHDEILRFTLPPRLRCEYQLRAAALSFAARVLAGIEGSLP